MTAGAYLELCERLISVAVLISCLEHLARPAVLADTGLAGWPVGRLSRRWKTGPWSGPLDALLVPARYRGLLIARVAAAVVLLLPTDAAHARTAALAVVTVGAALAQVRSSYGHDGADQMCLVVGGGLLIARVGQVPEAGAWFVAAQACLAYATAGLKKAASPVWRSGAALPGVMGTTVYGHPFAHRVLLARPRLARVGCFSVIGVETAFPLVLLGSAPLTLLLLGVGVAFHATTAVLMRLNTFFWAFTATYPAIVYVSLVR